MYQFFIQVVDRTTASGIVLEARHPSLAGSGSFAVPVYTGSGVLTASHPSIDADSSMILPFFKFIETRYVKNREVTTRYVKIGNDEPRYVDMEVASVQNVTD